MAQYLPPETLAVGDGTETVFGFTFPYLLATDIALTVDGVPTSVYLTGTAQMYITPAPAVGAVVRMYRDTPAQYPKHLFATGVPMLPKYLDENNRQMLYALQEGLLEFNAVRQVSEDAAEAAAAAQAAAEEAAFIANTAATVVTTSLGRVVRAPLTDPLMRELPPALVRAGKIMGFDAAGDPIGTLPATGSGTELAIDLANPVDADKGAGMVGYSGTTVALFLDSIKQFILDLKSTAYAKGAALVGRSVRNVDTVADLVQVAGRYTGDTVVVTSYWGGWSAWAVPRPEGGGTFVWDAASIAPTDSGSCFAGPGTTGRWLRKFGSRVMVTEFGARTQYAADATASINAALDYVEARRGTVFIPDGEYTILGTILLRNFCTLEGESMAGVILGNQWDSRAVPVLANKDKGTFMYSNVRNMNLRGGTAGLISSVTSETAYNTFENITVALTTAGGFSFNKMLQTSAFINVTFDRTISGVTCEGPTANLNYFERCNFMRLSALHLKFISSEVNNFVSCQFEEGGLNGNVGILLSDCRDLNFRGCYFERTHNNLLLETGATNGRSGVFFDGCHFTGAWNQITETIDPYIITSDGIMKFGTNSWYRPCNGPAQILMTGDNAGMLGNDGTVYTEITRNSARYQVARAAAGTGVNQYRVARIRRSDTAAGSQNAQTGHLDVRVNVMFANAAGVPQTYAATFPVSVTGLAGAPIGVVVGTPVVAQNTGGLTVTLAVEPGPTAAEAWVRASVSGAAAPVSGYIKAFVDAVTTTTPGYSPLEITAQ